MARLPNGWMMPTEKEAEALGAISYRHGPKEPAETIATEALLRAWRRGWRKAAKAESRE